MLPVHYILIKFCAWMYDVATNFEWEKEREGEGGREKERESEKEEITLLMA